MAKSKELIVSKSRTKDAANGYNVSSDVNAVLQQCREARVRPIPTVQSIPNAKTRPLVALARARAKADGRKKLGAQDL